MYRPCPTTVPSCRCAFISADGLLIGEFGEERRNLTRLKDMPKVMTDAVLAIEDTRFYEHGGVDYKGMVRAALANLGNLKSQGASTITMQVARNVYLSSEKTYTRKIYEVLLTFKLEHLLTKDQILEIYMNQIFLGNRAYGFAAASEAYFDKPLKNITIAEAAMLAGLPKAPGTNNPIQQPQARTGAPADRDRPHAGDRLHHCTAGRQRAQAEKLKLKGGPDAVRVHAEYVAETVRQLVFAQYGKRNLYARPERLHHDQFRRSGCRLQGTAARHHGLRAAPDLPWAGEIRRPASVRPAGH